MTPWLILIYRWCERCGQKACNDHDAYCPSCLAVIEMQFEELTNG